MEDFDNQDNRQNTKQINTFSNANDNSAEQQQPPMETTEESDDLSILDLYEDSWKIKIIGVGGAGTNITHHLLKHHEWPDNVTIWALNTDAKSIKKNLTTKLNWHLLDREKLRGNGSGGDSSIGATAAKRDEARIKTIVNECDIVIVVAGLGKGTGSGGGPEVLRMAKEKGITTVAVVTFPAVNIEGEAAYENALKSYENYKKYADSICVVDNEKLIGGAKHTLTLEEEFTKSNEEVGEIVKDIVDIVATGSQVNIDLADLKNFLKSNKLLNHITIKIPNEDYSADHVTEIIDIRIKTASLKNNFSTKHVNILLNARFSANSPASIINDVKNALTEISQTDHVNILWGKDTIDGEMNIISLFISNEEKNVEIGSQPINYVEYSDKDTTDNESSSKRKSSRHNTKGIKKTILDFNED